jgi:hypothetical protein
MAGKQLGRSAHVGDANSSLADCSKAPIGVPSEAGLKRAETLPAFAFKTAATSAGAFGLRAGFVDVQGSAVDGYTVQSSNSLFALTIIVHFDKSKTSGLPGITICANVDASHGSMGSKQRTDSLFRRSKAEVAYINIFHSFCFLYWF